VYCFYTADKPDMWKGTKAASRLEGGYLGVKRVLLLGLLFKTFQSLFKQQNAGRFERASRLEGGDLGQQRVLLLSLRRRPLLHRLCVAVALPARLHALLLRALRQVAQGLSGGGPARCSSGFGEASG
jgi:hypothetical protein